MSARLMSNRMVTPPEADVLAEARRLAAIWEAAHVRARLLGGIAIAFHAHTGIPEPLRRTYGDIDLVIPRSEKAAYKAAMLDAGYEENKRFNAIHGTYRLMLFEPLHERWIDTFVGEFRMSHSLDLDEALPVSGSTLEPADLLLTKLQVAEINAKDLTDVLVLLVDHDLGEGGDAISVRRLAGVLGNDWGWHATVSDNLEKLRARLDEVPRLEPSIVARIGDRIDRLDSLLSSTPKSLRWKARARIGRKVPWFDLPDESR